ncbi:MAG: hypothetical protein RL154_1443, partial [Pseudomonadota bacterium]
MISKLITDQILAQALDAHCEELIRYMLNTSTEFGIVCDTSEIKFDPILPKDIAKTIKPVALFMLAGYSFESAVLNEDSLVFEAGFGSENFGALVEVKIEQIIQIAIEDTPIFINVTAGQKNRASAQTVAPSSAERS